MICECRNTRLEVMSKGPNDLFNQPGCQKTRAGLSLAGGHMDGEERRKRPLAGKKTLAVALPANFT